MSRESLSTSAIGARRYRALQLLAALAVLALGTLVYVVDRPEDATPHLSALHALAIIWPHHSLGPIADHLPTFAHAFAFSVLTALALGPAWRAVSCLGWLSTNAAFEVGQHPRAAEGFAMLLPSSLEQAPLVDALVQYFVSGTFDVGDLVSICVGAAAAYALLRYRVVEVIHG